MLPTKVQLQLQMSLLIFWITKVKRLPVQRQRNGMVKIDLSKKPFLLAANNNEEVI